jgi:hypothetical protein
MQLDAQLFRSILEEMIDENPLAVRAVLRILRVEFCSTVPTLAVTLEEQPRLLVNLQFLADHCEKETHVKACIAHEFLHVLLGHTERFKRMTQAQNVALDAIINSIIHRTMGPEYSQFFGIFYSEAYSINKLLRPPTEKDGSAICWEIQTGQADEDASHNEHQLLRAWEALYKGQLVSDDVMELSKDFQDAEDYGSCLDMPLIGNHEAVGQELPEALEEALNNAMKQMNGDGIWRSPKDRGVGTLGYESLWAVRDVPLELWKRRALEVLKRCLIPDNRSSLLQAQDALYRVPVLSPRDRRAFLRSMWSPVLPESDWTTQVDRPTGCANVYLDVSGSMNAEMPLIISLLGQLRKAIRMPFWAFSDEVCPATIKDGRLVTTTTGGTSMACVLKHVAETRPSAAVVVTDGYIEAIDLRLLDSLRTTRLHALVTRDGTTSNLRTAGIPYTQLEKLP